MVPGRRSAYAPEIDDTCIRDFTFFDDDVADNAVLVAVRCDGHVLDDILRIGLSPEEVLSFQFRKYTLHSRREGVMEVVIQSPW